jgi:predicted MFS family arabinose efflux permease
VGFAPTYGWLIALRVVQGIAVGAAIACAPALATLLFEDAAKRRVLGIYVTAISLGAALGPVLGGVLIGWLGWPGVFWARVPLALLVFALLPLVADVRASAGAHAGAGMRLLRIEPFRSRAFCLLQVSSVAINLACFSIMLLIPYVLIGWREVTLAAGGLVLAMFPGGALLGGLIGARLTLRVSSAWLVQAGMLAAALGLLLTSGLVAAASPVLLGGALAVTGIGLGTFQVGYMDRTTSLLPREERGVAASLVNVTRLAGVLLGASGVSWLYERLHDFPQTFAAVGAGLAVFGIVHAALVRVSTR